LPTAFFQPRKCQRGLPGIQIPAAREAYSIRLACRPVVAFVAAYVPSCQRGRRRVRTALPGAQAVHHASPHVFAFAKTSAQQRRGFRLTCRRLSTCNPLPHYGVLITSLTATHRLPTGGRSGSCVSQFLQSMSSVSERLSPRGKYDSECGRQAAPLFKRLDPKVQPIDFRLRN